tara:strand:+ start:483 stop:668 length:186 start_codon:yes stop_codon:yes gene_type:complete
MDAPTSVAYIHPASQSAKRNGIITLIIKSRTAKTKTSEKGKIIKVDIKGCLSISVLILFIF